MTSPTGPAVTQARKRLSGYSPRVDDTEFQARTARTKANMAKGLTPLGNPGRSKPTPKPQPAPRTAAPARSPARSTRTTSSRRRTGRSRYSATSPFRARSRGSYSQMLLLEYLVAAVLILLGVFVGTDHYAKKMSAALLRLTALTGLFFVLALVASGPGSGKFAATFGLLIDVGVLFDSANSGHLQTIASVLKGGGSSDTGATVEPASYETTSTPTISHSILNG